MWDERYNTEEYVYGTNPNEFLRANINSIPKGKVLSLAEGEGRNAVFLAELGYEVTAVDSSMVGIEKGRQLAKSNGVKVEFIHADLASYELGQSQWDGVVSIFCPLPSSVRRALHRKVMCGLKPGGVLLLEAYTPEQIKYGTGGGNNAELMQTKDSLVRELTGLNFQHLVELERDVIEGIFHTGIGSVVQAIARKEC